MSLAHLLEFPAAVNDIADDNRAGMKLVHVFDAQAASAIGHTWFLAVSFLLVRFCIFVRHTSVL